MKSTIAKHKISGVPKVLVVDLSMDGKSFEYDMTRTICQRLKQLGVPVTTDSPAFVKAEQDFAQAVNERADFNCLLLITHGGKDPKNGKASKVAGPGGTMDWYSLALLSDGLRDKLVMLAVCYGFCEDAVAAFTEECSWALGILGSEVSLNSNEAMAFFPAFLSELSSMCLESIDPAQVRLALEGTQQLAAGKMQFMSDALPI